MAKRIGEKIPKERVSIVVSREARKHLSFIALEKEMGTPGEAVDYLLSYFDRTGNLKKKRTDVISPGMAIPVLSDDRQHHEIPGERDYIPTL